MVGGCLSCFFTYISALLLGVFLYDVEASSCQRVVHKNVGDTVELSSCLTTEGVTSAKWKYGGLLIADKDGVVFGEHQFNGRSDLNLTNLSLTVRGLTLQDSGNFSFVSAVDDKQRGTVTISLHVHEPITQEPTLISNSTWQTSNESCTVLLECSATSDSSVTYNWTVMNQTISGSRLQYTIRPQDGHTKFTCTVSNVVSEKSANKIVKCSNITSDTTERGPNFIVLLSAAGGGCLLLVIIAGVVVCVCHGKKSQEGIDSNDLTLYADISEVAIAGGSSSTMKPCTLYETIDNKVDTVAPGPQTVYDKIQFSRMRNASVSPYQDIS